MKIEILYYIFTTVVLSYVPAEAKLPVYNTLPNIKVRTTAFVAKVIDNTCNLNPQVGPCRANIEMYYFNSNTMACETFHWGGCMGNGNRFDSEEECMDHCLSKKDAPNKPPVYCSLNFDYGFCFGNVKRWYYDRLWKVCKETIYSGCGGNFNNFYTKERCDKVCQFGILSRDSDFTTDAANKKVVIIDSIYAKKKNKKGKWVNGKVTPPRYVLLDKDSLPADGSKTPEDTKPNPDQPQNAGGAPGAPGAADGGPGAPGAPGAPAAPVGPGVPYVPGGPAVGQVGNAGVP